MKRNEIAGMRRCEISRCLPSLKRSLRLSLKGAEETPKCALCARAKWCLPAPLARHPFASHGPNLGRASRLTHSAPSSSQVSADRRAPGGRSGYPKAFEGASGWKKGARHPPTSPRSNSSAVAVRHLSRAQEQQPVRVAVSVSALSASARVHAGALPSGMQPGVSGCSSTKSVVIQARTAESMSARQKRP